jgi:hypothetical protein
MGVKLKLWFENDVWCPQIPTGRGNGLLVRTGAPAVGRCFLSGNNSGHGTVLDWELIGAAGEQSSHAAEVVLVAQAD